MKPTKTFIIRCHWTFTLKDMNFNTGLIVSSGRSEEHTSELQSHSDLVCRLLLEKKKNTYKEQTREEANYTQLRQKTPDTICNGG